MPEGTPALQGIIAKVMIIVERILDEFVSIEMNQTSPIAANNVCVGTQFSGDVTLCGAQLVDLWANAVFVLSKLVGELLGALGVYVPAQTYS